MRRKIIMIMKTSKSLMFLSVIVLLLFFVTNINADVKKVSTSKMEFKGTMGAVMKFLGAAKPTTIVEYYKDNIYKSDTINEKGKLMASQIIDLDRELFISIDHNKKRYTQMTFDEWRKMIEQNIPKTETEQEKATEVEWDVNIDISKSGETETIAGKKTEKVIIKLTISAKVTEQEREESQPQSTQGEMIVTSSYWMANEQEGQQEIKNFQNKLVEKLGMQPGQGGLEEIMSRMTQSNPQLADAMKKLQEESKKLTGVPLRTHAVYETINAAGEVNNQTEQEDTQIPTSVGGLFKKFGKKITKSDENDSNQNILMETKTEVTKFEVAPIDSKEFEIPEKYKMQKN